MDVLLKDVLRPGLRLVLCGTAPSTVSAKANAYYAKPGNRFWPILYETGITPCLYPPQHYKKLLGLGIGLTDLCKTHAGNDADLPVESLQPALLRKKIIKYKPDMVAFTSLNAGRIFLGRRSVTLGLQEETIEQCRLFICCSTSGINSHWAEQKHSWHELAHLLRKGGHLFA